MVITLEPKLEEALKAQAEQAGVAPEELALSVLRQQLLPPIVPQDDWERRLLSIGVPCGVSLSDEAVSSEGIY
jgi:hypothetical protein